MARTQAATPVATAGAESHRPGPRELYDGRRGVAYQRPLWRGWTHLVCFEVSLVIGTVLIASAQGTRQTVAAAIYAGAVSALFGTSALYHRGHWSPRAALWLQRLDQTMILTLIAGTSTPPLLLCLPIPTGAIVVVLVWTVTAAIAVIRLRWLTAPERLVGGMFVALGWAAAGAIPAVEVSAGIGPVILLVVGGLLYTIGAMCYHWRRPDPAPTVFGYHEVFHLLVCAAAACHYTAIAVYLL